MALVFIPKHFDIKFEEKCHIVFSVAPIEKGMKYYSTVGEWRSIPEVETDEQVHWFCLLYTYKASTSELASVNAMISFENYQMTLEFTCDIRACEVIRSSFHNITPEDMMKLVNLYSPVEKPLYMSCESLEDGSLLPKDYPGDNQTSNFECKQCGKFFCDLNLLEIHMKEHEYMVQPWAAVVKSPLGMSSKHLKPRLLSFENDYSASIGIKSLDYSVSVESYNNPKSFEIHKDQHTTLEQPSAATEKSLTSSEDTAMEPLVKEMTVRILNCRICHKNYRTRESMMKHLATHTDLEKDEALSRLNSKNTKIKKKKLICHKCGKAFYLESKLNKHMNKKHNDTGPTAFVENKVFSNETFKEPRKSQRKLKKIRCPVCSGDIVGRRLFNQHYKMHDGDRK